MAMSQNIINKEQEWNVLHSYDVVTTRCYKFTTDTVIKGNVYTTLEYSNSEHFDPRQAIFAGLIREDGDKVQLRYLNGQEYTLYDFSVVQGDTIDMGMINQSYPISFRCDTTDSVYIYGKNRYRLTMTPLNTSDATPQLWIQGVGSTAGIAELSIPKFLNYKTVLLCSNINDSIIWKSEHPFCYFTNAPTQSQMLVKTGNTCESVEDCPEAMFLNISSKIKNTGLIIKVYDEEGELVLKRKINKEKDLDFSKLDPGEYTIQLTDSFDRVYALKKIVI